jgi:hypothetical protein
MKIKKEHAILLVGGAALLYFLSRPKPAPAVSLTQVSSALAENISKVQEAIAKGDYETAYKLLEEQEKLKAQIVSPQVPPEAVTPEAPKAELTAEEKSEIQQYVENVDLPPEEKQQLLENMTNIAESLKAAELGYGLRVTDIWLAADFPEPPVTMEYMEKLYHEDYSEYCRVRDMYTVTLSWSLNGLSGRIELKPDIRKWYFEQIWIDPFSLTLPGKFTFKVSSNYYKPARVKLYGHAETFPREYIPGVIWKEDWPVWFEGWVDSAHPVTIEIDIPYPAGKI